MHLILDVQAQRHLDNGAWVAAFILNLISLLPGIRVRFGPHVEYFANGSSYGPGITAIAIISESHIVVHTAPERKLLQLDVFSCQKFPTNLVIDLVAKTFGTSHTLLQEVIER